MFCLLGHYFKTDEVIDVIVSFSSLVLTFVILFSVILETISNSGVAF